MKILTKEEADQHYAVVINGGIKGMAYSSAIAIPASFYLHRAWPYYRSLPLSLKVLGVITVTVPVCVVKAELDGNAWERARWHDVGKMEMDQVARKEAQRVAGLSGTDKVWDWAAQRRYSIVGASWALSMALAFGIVMRNPYQTLPQKIVQARMWAQGLTVGVLIASAGLSAGGPARHQIVDHSWAAILEEQQKERQAREAANNIVPSSK